MAEENLTAQEQTPLAAGTNGAPAGTPNSAISDAQTSKTGLPNAPADEGKQAPTKVEDKAPEAKAEDKPEDKVETPAEFMTYDHPAADAAVAMLKEAGVLPDEANAWFKKVAETGDVNAIDTDAIIAKMGADKGALVVSAVKDYYNRELTGIKQQADAVVSQFGNKANFDLVKNWAINRAKGDKAFDAKLGEYRKMIDIGPESAKIAARELKAAYNADPKNRSLDVKITEGSGTPQGQTGETLTRADYITKMKEAEARSDYPEMARLRSLRIGSLKAG